jgi:hypothetical protein
VILIYVLNDYRMILASALVQVINPVLCEKQNLLKRGEAGKKGKGERGKPSDFSDNLTIKTFDFGV